MISLQGENRDKNPHTLRKQLSLEVTLFSREITFPISLFIYKEVARLNDLMCPAWDVRGTAVKAEGERIFVLKVVQNRTLIYSLMSQHAGNLYCPLPLI